MLSCVIIAGSLYLASDKELANIENSALIYRQLNDLVVEENGTRIKFDLTREQKQLTIAEIMADCIQHAEKIERFRLRR